MVFVTNCSLSLSLLWAQWEDNCGIHVGSPLCQMPGPLNSIQLMHSNVSDGPQKLIAIRCFKKISESLMHYSGYYVDISEARVCLQPVHPRNVMWIHDILIWVQKKDGSVIWKGHLVVDPPHKCPRTNSSSPPFGLANFVGFCCSTCLGRNAACDMGSWKTLENTMKHDIMRLRETLFHSDLALEDWQLMACVQPSIVTGSPDRIGSVQGIGDDDASPGEVGGFLALWPIRAG